MPRTLPIQTSNPASANRKATDWWGKLVTQSALEARRPCWRKKTGREEEEEAVGRSDQSDRKGRRSRWETRHANENLKLPPGSLSGASPFQSPRIFNWWRMKGIGERSDRDWSLAYKGVISDLCCPSPPPTFLSLPPVRYPVQLQHISVLRPGLVHFCRISPEGNQFGLLIRGGIY